MKTLLLTLLVAGAVSAKPKSKAAKAFGEDPYAKMTCDQLKQSPVQKPADSYDLPYLQWSSHYNNLGCQPALPPDPNMAKPAPVPAPQPKKDDPYCKKFDEALAKMSPDQKEMRQDVLNQRRLKKCPGNPPESNGPGVDPVHPR